MTDDPVLTAWIRGASTRDKLHYRAQVAWMRIRKVAAIVWSRKMRRRWRTGADILIVGRLGDAVPWPRVAAICRLSGMPLATFADNSTENESSDK